MELVPTQSTTHDVSDPLNDEHFATFTIGDQLFGIPIDEVQGMLHLHDIADVPLSSEKVRGLTNLRGHIVTVIDTRVCLGMDDGAQVHDTEKNVDMGVTVDHNDTLYTLLIDRISDVVSLSSKDYEGAPSTLDQGLRRFARGVYRLESELMVVLDLDVFLDAVAA